MSMDKFSTRKILIGLVGACLLSIFLSCTAKPNVPPDFTKGELVQTKLDHRVGMVIDVWWDPTANIPTYLYDVKFPTSTVKTDTHLLDSDGPITMGDPYVVMTMKSFELEPYTSKNILKHKPQ